MAETNRAYSRSQWSNLSIQERIKAMNQNLGDQAVDASTAPQNNIPKRTKSVVDIWRNNAPSNDSPAPSSKPYAQPMKKPGSESEPAQRPALKRPTIASASPTPPQIPRVRNCSIEAPDITVIPASGTPTNRPDTTTSSTSRIKNVSKMWETMSTNQAVQASVPTVKRQSVVDLWNRQRNDSVDEQNEEKEDVPRSSPTSPRPVSGRFANSFDTAEDEELVAVQERPLMDNKSNSIKNRWSFEESKNQEDERPPTTRINSRTFEKQEKLLNRFMTPQDNVEERPKWARQNSLERGSRIAPANSWIDKQKNSKPVSPPSPRPAVAQFNSGRLPNEHPPLSPALSRHSHSNGSWMEKQNKNNAADSMQEFPSPQNANVNKLWQPKTSVSDRWVQRDSSDRTDDSHRTDESQAEETPMTDGLPFEFRQAFSTASGSWSQKDLDAPATPKANEIAKRFVSPGGGGSAALRNMFEKQGEETKPVARRWAQRVGRASEKNETKAADARWLQKGSSDSEPPVSQEAPVVNVASAEELLNNADESPKQSPWPSLRKTGSTTPKVEPSKASSEVEESAAGSPWPALRKTDSVPWQKPGPAFPNLDAPEEAVEVPTVAREETKPPARPKVTDRYIQNVVPHVDTAVSDLVKQHASRTPVGKSRNKNNGQWDSPEHADRTGDPIVAFPEKADRTGDPIVAFPEKDDDTDEEEAFHQMVVEHNRDNLDEKNFGSRTLHSEPVVPIKVNESVSELVKKHAVRTPSGKTRNKVAGLWNSAINLDAEGGLEVERVSESQTETETEIREVDPEPVQESLDGGRESRTGFPSPEKRSMAANRWQKRMEKKSLVAKPSEGESPNSTASTRGKIADRWTKRVESPNEERSEPAVVASMSSPSPIVPRSLSSDRGDDEFMDKGVIEYGDVTPVMTAIDTSSTIEASTSRTEVDKSTGSKSANTGHEKKKINVMQLGRKHTVNRHASPPKEKELSPSKSKDETQTNAMIPTELIKNVNSSSTKVSSSFDSSLGSRKTGIPSYSPGTKKNPSNKGDTQSTNKPETVAVCAGASSAITQRIAKERLFNKKKLHSQRRRKAKPVDQAPVSERKSMIPPPKETSRLTVLGLARSGAGDAEKALSDFSLPSEGSFGDIGATGSNLSASSLANRAEKLLQRRRRKDGSEEDDHGKKEALGEAENVDIDDEFHDYYDGQDQASDALQKIQKSLSETPFMDQPTGIAQRPHGGFEDPSFEELESLVQEAHFNDGARRLTTRYNNATRFMDESAAGESMESSLLSHDSVTTGSFAREDAKDNVAPRKRRSKGRSGREDRSVNTTSIHSGWDPTSFDMSSLVSIDLKKIASAVDEQVSALRDLVGQQVTPRGTRMRSVRPSAEALEVEDVAIEVEYVEDTSSEPDPGSDLGVCASPDREKAAETQKAQAGSDMIPGEPSFEQQQHRRAFV